MRERVTEERSLVEAEIEVAGTISLKRWALFLPLTLLSDATEKREIVDLSLQ
jgi:hypothetical protein